jgi:hypothetical protein
MTEGYTAALQDGREIYIPNWSATVQFENLTQVCKVLGQENVIAITTDKSVPVAMLAIMDAEDHKLATKLVFHFIQQARIDGSKIDTNKIEQLGMPTITELFVHVLHSQYNDFFVSGLAKGTSPNK